MENMEKMEKMERQIDERAVFCRDIIVISIGDGGVVRRSDLAAHVMLYVNIAERDGEKIMADRKSLHLTNVRANMCPSALTFPTIHSCVFVFTFPCVTPTNQRSTLGHDCECTCSHIEVSGIFLASNNVQLQDMTDLYNGVR